MRRFFDLKGASSSGGVGSWGICAARRTGPRARAGGTHLRCWKNLTARGKFAAMSSRKPAVAAAAADTLMRTASFLQRFQAEVARQLLVDHEFRIGRLDSNLPNRFTLRLQFIGTQEVPIPVTQSVVEEALSQSIVCGHRTFCAPMRRR